MAEYLPPASFHFEVSFSFLGSDSGQDARFSEVSGLSSKLAIVKYDEAGESRFTHQLPGKPEFPPLILKRGLVTDSRLIEWFKNGIEFLEFEVTNVTVTLLNDFHEPVSAWEFTRAWPVKWSVSDFKAQDNSLTIETIELAYQYNRRTL